MRTTSVILAVGGLFGAMALGQGCSYVTNTTAIQCTSQAECVALGPGFEDTTCDAKTKTCVKVASAPECQQNSDCITKNGAFSMCRRSDKKCVSLISNECPAVLGSPDLLQNPDAIVLGAITPVASGELGDAIEKGVALAQREITPSSTGTGIATTANGQKRPVLVVSCHEFNSDGFVGLVAAANHLVKDLESPVVIGPVDPTDAQIVATNVTLPTKTLGIFPTSITSNLDTLSGGSTPLIWRLNYSDTQAATVVQHFINEVLVPKMKKDGMLKDEPLRIAIANEGDYKGKQVAQTMTSKLIWNTKEDGTTPATCADNIQLAPPACILGDFGSLNDTIGNPAPEGQISRVLGALLTNNGSVTAPPHIILHSYATFGIQRILFPVEAAWDNVHSPTSSVDDQYRPRPYHIGLFPPFNTFEPMFGFMDRQTSAAPPDLFKNLKERIFALYAHTAVDQLEIVNYETRYKTAYPEFNASASPRDVLPRQLYDATYMAVYAIVANGSKPLTGTNLAATLPRLLQGQTYKVGPDDLQKAASILSTADQGINLEGLSGTLDLNASTGSPKYSVEISCVGQKTDGTSTNFVPSGYYYDEAAGAIAGTFPGPYCKTLAGKW